MFDQLPPVGFGLEEICTWIAMLGRIVVGIGLFFVGAFGPLVLCALVVALFALLGALYISKLRGM